VIICDFDESRRIGKPKDWVSELDGECGDIFVMDAIDTLSGQNFMYSLYKPTPEDLAALNNGGALRLGIAGRSHPVFNMAVVSPRLAEAAGLRLVWDMGPVIDLNKDGSHA
jgi:hypothetical protein